MGAFLRSTLFTIYFFIITIIFGSIIPLARIFFLPLRVRYFLAITWMRLVLNALQFICGVHYHIQGLEHIPKDRNGVILCKHQSTWETFFVPPLFNLTSIIIKKELLPIPLFGWALASIEPIAIDRSSKLSAMEQILKFGKQYLAAGRWILVFPEGTRTAPGKMGKYHISGARLAAESGYPVLPIAHNAGLFWPRRKFIKRPGTVQVVIGPLIESKGREAKDVLEEAKIWIESTMQTF